MRGIYVFNLVIVLIASLFTLNAIAAIPLKVHVLENLDPKEARLVMKELSRLGYQPTKSPLFTESTHAVVITKTLSPSLKTESISFEILEMNQKDTLPKTLIEFKDTASLESLLKKAPSPDQVRKIEPKITPVAALK